MIKICKICKKEFIYIGYNQKCCSLNCKKKNKQISTKNWKKQNKNTISVYMKKYRDKNRNRISKAEREYRNKYIIKYKKYYKLYRKLHREKLSKYGNKYDKNRRKIDINFKLAHYLRIRVNKVLKGINKSSSTLDLLGCSIDFLKQHLKSKFKPGMSWSNYGFYGWHVDHIIPCVSFDLSKPSEQARCFHFTNLQPLWAEENLRKNKYEQYKNKED
jgi:hypothetical protein